MIMTEVTTLDKALNDLLGLSPIPDEDAGERRWNDEKSRGWNEELHVRLVSTIARYKERGQQCDWVEKIKVK